MSDLDETATLLTVVEKASAHGTAFNYIRAAAMKRLMQIDDEHAPEDVKKAKAAKEKADKDAAEAAAKAKAMEERANPKSAGHEERART